MTASVRLDEIQSPTSDEVESVMLQVSDFLRTVCHNLLSGFPDVQRWDQTDDVFQAAALRLCRALKDTTPESKRHLENLAAVQVRRTLVDLGRKYASSLTMNTQRWTPINTGIHFEGLNHVRATTESDPTELIEWVELHEQIEHLPDDVKEVFQLIWYRGLNKEEVASLLEIDLRTVQRRWRVARELLAKYSTGRTLP